MRCDDGAWNLPSERNHPLKERPTGGNDFTREVQSSNQRL